MPELTGGGQLRDRGPQDPGGGREGDRADTHDGDAVRVEGTHRRLHQKRLVVVRVLDHGHHHMAWL